MADQRRSTGVAGEDAVARHYEAQGYTVVARNWRDGRRGELDLIVRRNELAVIVEVKTRRSSAFGDAVEAVTIDKQRRLRRLAGAWLATVRGEGIRDIRIDVAAVQWHAGEREPEIEIIEHAC
jgi:putative endonuclease